ncbi:MAG: Hsp70 family protein, partial [Endomicrobium sp.]|nr:Hsp70 family protein [Endomicrobium sp.]
LDGIPPAPRGVPQIEVVFDIDANGILHVSAKDKGTGKEQSIKISSSTKLSKDDIDKYVKEAEQYASEDAKHKEEIELRNEADNLVYSVEKSLKEHGDKVSSEERLAIEQALTSAKDALKGSDVATIKSTKETLTTASHKLAEAVYKASQAQGASSGVQQSSGDGEKIVDTEVVDDKNK